MNSVVLVGRLTRDPELRYLPMTGNPVTRFTLAVDRGLSKEKKQEMEAKNQPTADFINIVVWGKAAENCANYLTKGRLVAVHGRLQTSTYEKDGVRRYTTEVVANQVEFLEWGDTNKNMDFDNSDLDFGEIEGFHPTDDDDIPF
ncbi:MAG TPA: single-stranded DNA-binding protein [Tissierellaceae bacterium]